MVQTDEILRDEKFLSYHIVDFLVLLRDGSWDHWLLDVITDLILQYAQ